MATGRRIDFQTPGSLEGVGGLKATQQAIDRIRERFQLLEASVDQLFKLAEGSTSATTIAQLRSQVIQLQKQINLLPSQADLAALNALFANANGILVLRDGTIITRTIEPGLGITVTYGDGFGGNPTIGLGDAFPSTTFADGGELEVFFDVALAIEEFE